MTTLKEGTYSANLSQAEASAENGVDRQEMCKKICENILQTLLEGYEELQQKNPAKTKEFQPKIDEIKKQIEENRLNQKIDEIMSL